MLLISRKTVVSLPMQQVPHGMIPGIDNPQGSPPIEAVKTEKFMATKVTIIYYKDSYA